MGLWHYLNSVVARWFSGGSPLSVATESSITDISLREPAMDTSTFALELIKCATQTIYLGGNKVHAARAGDRTVQAGEAIDISQEMGDLTAKIIELFAQAVDSGADWPAASEKLERFYGRLGEATAAEWLGLED